LTNAFGVGHSANTMMTLKTEALFHARKLCRSLGSAPDPRQRVREIISTPLHGKGWSAASA
jgi:hypothetical protein